MNLEQCGIPRRLYTYEKKKRLKKTKNRQKHKNKSKKKVEVSSLTCLFVYKVLNQEVLDDRGKFEVSLVKK